eukprot:3932508-Rhodomonas_salina.1
MSNMEEGVPSSVGETPTDGATGTPQFIQRICCHCGVLLNVPENEPIIVCGACKKSSKIVEMRPKRTYDGFVSSCYTDPRWGLDVVHTQVFAHRVLLLQAYVMLPQAVILLPGNRAHVLHHWRWIHCESSPADLHSSRHLVCFRPFP